MVTEHAAAERRRYGEADIGVHALGERDSDGYHNRKCAPACAGAKRDETGGQKNHRWYESGANELLSRIRHILACAEIFAQRA